MQEKLEKPVLLNEYAFWQNSQEHPTLELVLMQFIPFVKNPFVFLLSTKWRY